MQLFIVYLAMLAPLVGAQWWMSPPPSIAQPATLCPEGAEFKFSQVWPSGFKAAVMMGKWVTGRRVVLHFQDGVPDLSHPAGAEVIAKTASSITFALSATPGHLAKDAFDLQGRGRPPEASAVIITCELFYPPPPLPPPLPPVQADSCDPYRPAMNVVDSWAGGYALHLVLSMDKSSAPAALQVEVVFPPPSNAAPAAAKAMAALPGAAEPGAVGNPGTKVVAVRLQKLRGAELINEGRKRGSISVKVLPATATAATSSGADAAADNFRPQVQRVTKPSRPAKAPPPPGYTPGGEAVVVYSFEMSVLAGSTHRPSLRCSRLMGPPPPPPPPTSPPPPPSLAASQPEMESAVLAMLPSSSIFESARPLLPPCPAFLGVHYRMSSSGTAPDGEPYFTGSVKIDSPERKVCALTVALAVVLCRGLGCLWWTSVVEFCSG